MNDRYGCAEEPRRVCHGIRQSEAEALAQWSPQHARLSDTTEDLTAAQQPWREAGETMAAPATSRMRGRAAGAACPV